MNFIVSGNSLLNELGLISGIIQPNPTISILENFHFELNNNKLIATASDLETTISTEIEVQSESVENFTVPAKLLLDTLKTFPDQPLTFTAKEIEKEAEIWEEEDNLSKVKVLELISEQGTYQIPIESADDFPMAPEIEEENTIQLPTDNLAKALNMTLFATANDELRPAMNGVHFELNEDSLKFVATDSNRLVVYSQKDFVSGVQGKMTIHKKPLSVLKNILNQSSDEEVKLSFTEVNTRFLIGNVVLTCRQIDAKYPAYQGVIPKNNDKKIVLDRGQLLTSLRRVSLFSSKAHNEVQLNFEGSQLIIHAQNKEFSTKAEEKLNCSYDGESLKVAYNGKFLLEMLNILSSTEVELSLSEVTRPGILTPFDGLEENEEILLLVLPLMTK